MTMWRPFRITIDCTHSAPIDRQWRPLSSYLYLGDLTRRDGSWPPSARRDRNGFTSLLTGRERAAKARRNAAEGKAFVGGILYGTDSVFADGVMGEIERDVVEMEKIDARDFQIVGLREASSKGSRRELLAPVRDLTIDHADDGVLFTFSLNKGCYATCLLREFMKAGVSQY